MSTTVHAPDYWLGKIDLIYQDDFILVINKHAGIYSHPNQPTHEVDSVSQLVSEWVDFPKDDFSEDESEENEIEKLRKGLVHRLDRDTSGLMIISRTPVMSEVMKFCFKYQLVEKKYTALLQGNLYQTVHYEDYLDRDPQKRNRRKVVSSGNQEDDERSRLEGGRLAILDATPIKIFPNHTLMEVDLITGRTHQIRVQFAHRGHPVLGDPLYDRNYKNNSKKLKLHLCAQQISFYHPKHFIEANHAELIEYIQAGKVKKVDRKIDKMLENFSEEHRLHFKIDLPDYFQKWLDENQ